MLCIFTSTLIYSQELNSPKTIVVSGNRNVSFGQCIAGHTLNGYNVGIRIPTIPLTSIEGWDTPLAPFLGKISPNPCEKTTQFNGENIKDIRVYTIQGSEVLNCVEMKTRTITFPSSGVYLIKMTNTTSASQTFTIISK